MFTKFTVTMMLASVLGGAQGRPNIIIMQPDDFPFMDEWTAPPRNAHLPSQHPEVYNEGNGLQHINKLRLGGVEMMQAYTASPVCGTSRYSTITGKMPGRAVSVAEFANPNSSDPTTVTIPTTKLTDASADNLECYDNLAMAFANEAADEADKYRTGMFGKWHLSEIADEDYDYDDSIEIVKGCGFDTVGALYVENLAGVLDHHGHNMEFVTFEAINFIKDATDNDQNFFMYFNPTVPHSSGDVLEALSDRNCETDIPDPSYDFTANPLSIKGMVDSTDAGCEAYRQSVLDRGVEADDYGKIWVDDSVGALLQALNDTGVLDDTIFLFQEDHGMDTKQGLYEGGIRIPQFVHYPNGIEPSKFNGLVSTVDIAATMLDYAGIPKPYEMDGMSWKDAMISPGSSAPSDAAKVTEFNDRCLFFEVEQDRAVRCGCHKYLDIFNDKSKTYGQSREGWGLVNDIGGVLFDLCGGTDTYITDADKTQEAAAVSDPSKERDLVTALQCHLRNTAPLMAGIPNDQIEHCTTDRFCQDSPLEIEFQGSSLHTCEAFIAANDSRCSRPKFGNHCRESCDKCNSCRDSKATFDHPDGTTGSTTCIAISDADCDAYPELALWTCPVRCGNECW